MTYPDALNNIHSLLAFGSRPGLDRIRELLYRMNNPQDKLRFVHVAGTNGKGSTCAMISAVLRKAGYKTGLFISPYITDFRERIQINNIPVSEETLLHTVKKTFPLVEQLRSEGIVITEFEYVNALEFYIHAEANCDVVVLEAGMGGLLDCTNVIAPPLCAVITSIGLDHTTVLGETIEAIATQKCGILKLGSLAVTARGYVQAERLSGEEDERLHDVPQGDEETKLIEFWYKRYDADAGRTRVHMAQLAGHALLYSTELGFGGAQKEEYAQGVYAHGLYPFTMYKYRQVWRRPFGTGLMHDYEETQRAIDRYQKYIDDNARHSSVQRHFIRRGSGINADDVADLNRTIIEWEGSDIREVLQTVQAQPINGQVYQIMQYLTDMMKQDCGQNQFNRGEGGLGVTAASAIRSLQEAGSKIGRWHTEMFKDAFREMIEQMLWVLSEYMEPGRTLRIVGGWDSTGSMSERLVTLMAADAQGDRLLRPAYTVRVQVQRSNPLQIQADNEFLLQAAQICAQYGRPLPPQTLIGLMEGYRTKSSVLRAVQESEAGAAPAMTAENGAAALNKEGYLV